MIIPSFDDNGNLQPYKAIELDLSVVEDMFTYNTHRKDLFYVFKNYLVELNSTLKTPFALWIDGSFVTKKKNPNDIDLVVFVNANEYEYKKGQLWGFKEKYKYQDLDIHLVPVYPYNHKNRVFITDYLTSDYYKLFDSDRADNKKGFIQLKFPLK